MQKIQTFLSFCKRKGEGMNVFIGLKKISFWLGAILIKLTFKNLMNHSKFTNRISFFKRDLMIQMSF